MAVEVREAISEEEVKDGYELASKTFGPDYFTSHEVKTLCQRLDPLEDLRDAIVAVGQGAVVGFLRIVDREVCLGDAVLKTGGIASVCVRPDWRGKGYGRALMEEAVARLQQRKDSLSIVFGRHAVDGFYSQFGYVGIGCHTEMNVDIAGRSQPEVSGLILRHGVPDQNEKFYESAYMDSYSSLPFSFRRPSSWWANLSVRLHSRIEPEGFVTLCVEDRPVGYFVVHQKRIIEVAALNGMQGCVVSGLRSFAAGTGGNLTLSLPLSHWGIQAFRGSNHTLRIRYSWDGGHLLRIVDLDSLVRTLEICHKRWDGGVLSGLDEMGKQDTGSHAEAGMALKCLCGVVSEMPAEFGLQANWNEVLPPLLPTWTFLDEY